MARDRNGGRCDHQRQLDAPTGSSNSSLSPRTKLPRGGSLDGGAGAGSKARLSPTPTLRRVGARGLGRVRKPPRQPPFCFSPAHTASGVKGLLNRRTPTALKMAFPMAGSGPLMPISLTDLAP